MANYEELFNLILEAEEDHKNHMKKKEEASKQLNPSKSLINKKYVKNPDKADVYYKGKEVIASKDKSYIQSSKNISDKQFETLHRSHDYLRKLSSSNDEKDIKKFNTGIKAIRNITKTPGDYDITYSTTDNSDENTKPGDKTKTVSALTWKNNKTENLGKRIKLDKNKKYYHASPKKGLKFLNPQREGKSNRLDFNKDEDGFESKSSYFYPKGRIYITENKPAASYAGDNGAIYELIDVPEYGYTNRIGYYIEPEKPLRVKDVTSEFIKQESVIDIKLDIYESCYFGEITEEERNILLEKVESVVGSRLSFFKTNYMGYELHITYEKGTNISDESMDHCKSIIKNFDFVSFETKLNKFLKTEYDEWVDNVLDETDDRNSFNIIKSSIDRIRFSFDIRKSEKPEDFEIWVSYKKWGNRDKTDLCPEVECDANLNGKMNMVMHLG